MTEYLKSPIELQQYPHNLELFKAKILPELVHFGWFNMVWSLPDGEEPEQSADLTLVNTLYGDTMKGNALHRCRIISFGELFKVFHTMGLEYTNDKRFFDDIPSLRSPVAHSAEPNPEFLKLVAYKRVALTFISQGWQGLHYTESESYFTFHGTRFNDTQWPELLPFFILHKERKLEHGLEVAC